MIESVIDGVGLRRFSVEEYHRMGEAGVFGPRERVELIRGVIRNMSPKGRRHVIAVSKIIRTFVPSLAGRAMVYVQDPLVQKGLESELQPDFWVTTNPDPLAYGTASAPAALVIEVSDSSLEYDRTVKAALYAEASIRDYWIVNLIDNVLEVLRDPEGDAYQSRTRLRVTDTIAPLAWPDLTVVVGELLP
jgi:Uma2 family endonuclease